MRRMLECNSHVSFAPELARGCTRHGLGSRQASSNGMKEQYHSSIVIPIGHHGMEKLYSHESANRFDVLP